MTANPTPPRQGAAAEPDFDPKLAHACAVRWQNRDSEFVGDDCTGLTVGNLARAYLAREAEAKAAQRHRGEATERARVAENRVAELKPQAAQVGPLREALRSVQIKRRRPGRHCRQCGGRWIAQAERHAPGCLAAPGT